MTMSPPDAFPEDVVDALSAITITGPDAQNLLWVSCKTDDPLGMLSVNADTIAGHAVARWRDIRGAALAKAVLARASQPET